MTKLEKAARQALEALEDAASDLCSLEDYSTAFQEETITALRQAIANAEQRKPVGKLKVTLEDRLEERPIYIELAQYKRMFEAACSALGAVNHALGCDPYEGGAEPLLAAIEELKSHPQPRTWVGLTKEEVDSWELPDCPTVFEFVQFIEAKVKEKNT